MRSKLLEKKAAVLIIGLFFFALFPFFYVKAADGSGTNTVSPASAIINSVGNTFNFTFTAAETMDSGEIKLLTPAGWSAMQGVDGTAGYTTVSSVGGIIADVVNNLNAATGWTATQHMGLAASTDVNASSAPASAFSLANTITATAAANEQWYFNYASATNWGTNNGNGTDRIGFWLKSSVNTASGNISWQDSTSTNLANPIDTVAIPALTANTWTYSSVTLGASRASQLSYGFRYTTDIGAATLKVDSISKIFDTADTNTGWGSDGSITRSVLSTAGNFQEGTGAIRCAYAAGAGIGTSGDCFNNEGTVITLGPGTTVSFWVRSSIALNAGDFAFVDDNSSNLASVLDTVNLPSLSANTWTYITLNAPNSATARSYGLRQLVDKGVMNIDIDAIGKQIDAADSTTGWTAPTAIVQTLSADTATFHEGTASLKNVIAAAASTGDGWYQTLGLTQNWSAYTTVGFWIRSTVATNSGDLQFQYAASSNLTSPIASFSIGALSANTWTYQKLTLSGARSTVNSFGIQYITDIGAATVNLDDILIGPGNLTFAGGAADARVLSLASGQTVVFTYGNGGGASGVTAPSTAGMATATTTDRISDSGILANITSQPTLIALNPLPTTTSISPTSTTVFGAQFTLTVNGANFVSNSIVNVNGIARATTFISANQITATILASDIAAAGTSTITVFNPAPGGGNSAGQTFTIIDADITPPTVSIVSPVNGATVSSTIAVIASANDNVGVLGVQFKLDGVNLGAETTSSPFMILLNTSSSADGSYSLTASARDLAGNISTSSITTVTIDNNSPSVPLNLLATATSSSEINLAWTASVDTVGVLGYVVLRDGSNVATTTTAFYQDIGLAASTIYNYAVKAFDAAGNVSAQSTSSSATTFLPTDTISPQISITSPSNNATVSGVISIEADASDNVGVLAVQFKLDDANLGTENTSTPYSTLWDTTLSGNGHHVLKAIAHDAAGNSSTSVQISVIVDNPPPPSPTPAPQPVGGSSATANSTPAVSSANFYGQAYPGGLIKIFRKSEVIGLYESIPLTSTSIADDGTFRITIQNFLQANYFFAIQAIDKNGRASRILPLVSGFIPSGSNLISNSILVPPTTEIALSVIPAGQPVKVLGYAAPLGVVEIWVDDSFMGQTISDESGFYEFSTSTTQLSLANHMIKVRYVLRDGAVSDFSLGKVFKISTLAFPKTNLNGDGAINISDWSIFIYRWGLGDKALQSSIDFNGDGRVDISDLSILLDAMRLK